MRKVEKNMLNAVIAKNNWRSGSTTVNYDDKKELSTVYLHGNKIATIDHKSSLMVIFDGNFRSNTTKSRLVALGANLKQKSGEWLLDGHPFKNGAIIKFEH